MSWPSGFQEPLGLVVNRQFVRLFGTLREKERHGLLPRPHYAYGLLRAADMAAFAGTRSVTVCEFGVAAGQGLRNLAALAGLIERSTGISFRLWGFDTGSGLPPPSSYKDHPEIWRVGDFPLADRECLLRDLAGRARLVFGDINDTISGFISDLSEEAPLGFVVIDVDGWSGAVGALRVFSGAARKYTPAVSVYLDDVDFFFANRFCGELAAVEEFNQGQILRKVDIDRSLPGYHASPWAAWYRRMYVCHILDHELRQVVRPREALTMEQHHQYMLHRHLY